MIIPLEVIISFLKIILFPVINLTYVIRSLPTCQLIYVVKYGCRVFKKISYINIYWVCHILKKRNSNMNVVSKCVEIRAVYELWDSSVHCKCNKIQLDFLYGRAIIWVLGLEYIRDNMFINNNLGIMSIKSRLHVRTDCMGFFYLFAWLSIGRRIGIDVIAFCYFPSKKDLYFIFSQTFIFLF